MMQLTALEDGSGLVREVGAEHQAVGAEGIGHAAQRGRVAVADGVVPHPAGGHRVLLRGLGRLPRELVVHPLDEHR